MFNTFPIIEICIVPYLLNIIHITVQIVMTIANIPYITVITIRKVVLFHEIENVSHLHKIICKKYSINNYKIKFAY